MPAETRSSNTAAVGKEALRDIVIDSLVSMVAGVTGLVPPKGAEIPDFIQGQIDRATDRIHQALAQPAAQHQSEPILIQAVAVTRQSDDGMYLEWLLEGGISEMESPGQVLFAMPEANDLCDEDGSAEIYTRPVEQPAPVAVVPEGYCIMPRRLTAENGAKALLLGEFKLQSTHECPECRELEEPSEGCEIRDGEGEYGQKHTIPWDLIKLIYRKAVEGLAMKTEPAKSR